MSPPFKIKNGKFLVTSAGAFASECPVQFSCGSYDAGNPRFSTIYQLGPNLPLGYDDTGRVTASGSFHVFRPFLSGLTYGLNIPSLALGTGIPASRTIIVNTGVDSEFTISDPLPLIVRSIVYNEEWTAAGTRNDGAGDYPVDVQIRLERLQRYQTYWTFQVRIRPFGTVQTFQTIFLSQARRAIDCSTEYESRSQSNVVAESWSYPDGEGGNRWVMSDPYDATLTPVLFEVGLDLTMDLLDAPGGNPEPYTFCVGVYNQVRSFYGCPPAAQAVQGSGDCGCGCGDC